MAKVGYPFRRLHKKYKANKQLNEITTDRMNKKYPGGWSHSATKMAEFKKTKKNIYKGIGK